MPSTIVAFPSHSRFYQRLQRRYTHELSLLPAGVPTRTSMDCACNTLLANGHDLSAALRILRQLVLERLIVLDCSASDTPLHHITTPMTELAELALERACHHARSTLDIRHGVPQNTNGQPVQLWIVGMGKLGARELNVSSDIDLIYLYESEGETTGLEHGRGIISNHEYFSRAVKIIYQLIGETTEHGFVFRVDLALRPHGKSGPATCSLTALEQYLLAQGREWERFAWLKSRVVAPQACITAPQVQALRGIVLPFVFRRYLDYSVFDALRTLHRQIREHASKRNVGQPGNASDIKLSRGGIREIEFIVQLLQVVRGGQFPELRCRSTLQALQRLARAGLMSPARATQLADAYTFLRRVEHRIQYLDDQQTHTLPTCDDDLAWIAHTLGLSCCEFLRTLDTHRECVAQEFDTLLGGTEPSHCNGNCGSSCASNHTPDFETLLTGLSSTLHARISAWQTQPRIHTLREATRTKLLRIMQRTIHWLAEGRTSETAVARLTDWLDSLLRRESYLALLLERPAVHEHLLHLLGAAQWPARYLLQHPGLIDELASGTLLAGRFCAADFEHELELRLQALQSTGEDDDETLLNLLRRAHHAEVFRTLARDIEGRISVEQVADDLSSLADSVLRITCRWCWQRLKIRHRPTPQFAIIGYGKLGGKELGYGSDLDIVFAFDDDHDEDPRASEIYGAFARKLINWLTVKTSEGDLFEIDTALRPNGNSGLLVTRFAAYADYQQQRGSNTAWTWEHQAMTRARFVLGSESLATRFEAVRHAVITAPRDAAALCSEIVSMRQRLHAAHPVPATQFDIKHSPGGMLDAEFTVQCLVLIHSATHPGLQENLGNIALLQCAETAGLLPENIGQAAARAYRALRQAQHQARLDEAPARVPLEALATECNAILALWQAVFGASRTTSRPARSSE